MQVRDQETPVQSLDERARGRSWDTCRGHSNWEVWSAPPLNSKCLTATHLRWIASVLELPTTGAADQLRQVIEGKLETEGHEAINVQVVLEESALVKDEHLSDR